MENSEFALKKQKALRRKLRNRAKAKLSTLQHRLVVFRSNKYFYGQLIDSNNGNVVASVSTRQSVIKSAYPKTWGKEAVQAAGKKIAEDIKSAAISAIVFDRGQYVYSKGSKISIFADSIREEGIKI